MVDVAFEDVTPFYPLVDVAVVRWRLKPRPSPALSILSAHRCVVGREFVRKLSSGVVVVEAIGVAMWFIYVYMRL